MRAIKEPGRATVPSAAARIRWALWLLLSLLLAPVVEADTVLLSDTTLVSGSQSSTFSFQAPGSGTLSLQLTDIDWPQALSSLSVTAGNGQQLLASWMDNGSQSTGSLSFQVTSGQYFADVLADAGGALDLGAYSLSVQFTPAASPVPLPASGLLLLGGLACVFVLRRAAHAATSGTATY